MKLFLCVVGARPNFMKMAPLCRAMDARDECRYVLVHTGQHFDEKMSEQFFAELSLPEPHLNLGVHGGSHAGQTAAIMESFGPVLHEADPDAVVVVGDVNSTLACALVAAKAGVPVAHVEAGLRSFDRTMPEEINRIVTDDLSDFCFVGEPAGVENLRREGVPPERIHFVGNVMIDSLFRHLDQARRSAILDALGLTARRYALLTLHRPGNVDDRDTLARLLYAVAEIQETLPVVFPIHPRTRQALAAFGMAARLDSWDNLVQTEPLGYLDFLCLMDGAAVVLTDSGGIQEETTALGVPCLTLRENTERPVTIFQGTNQLVGRDPERIVAAVREVIGNGRGHRGPLPKFWDGRAAERILDVLVRTAAGPSRRPTPPALEHAPASTSAVAHPSPAQKGDRAWMVPSPS